MRLLHKTIAIQLPPHWGNPSDDGLIADSEFIQAIRTMEGNDPCMYITGKAGTGKSSLLKYWKNNTRKEHVVLSSTGTSAWDLDKSSTVHSFFNFQPGDSVHEAVGKTYWKNQHHKFQDIHTILIDEISMIRADFLDQIDEFLRAIRDDDRPFGGVQMIFFGDSTQLGPVVNRSRKQAFAQKGYQSPHFFDSHVLQEKIKLRNIELSTVRRQENKDLITKLNIIRERRISQDPKEIDDLNNGFIFQSNNNVDLDKTIFITTNNKKANKINSRKLNELPGIPTTIIASSSDKIGMKEHLPAPSNLQLKPGAKIMMTNNDSNKQWVNGSIGKILSLQQNSTGVVQTIQVKLESGDIVNVGKNTWYQYKDEFNMQLKQNEKIISGTYSQFPMKLAYAMTVHKAQGKSFDRVHIDLSGKFFASGQLYVALSRCRTLEGLSLSRPIQYKDIKVSQRVLAFLFWQKHSLEDFIGPNIGKAIYDSITKAIANIAWLQIAYVGGEQGPQSIMIKPKYITEGNNPYGAIYPAVRVHLMPNNKHELPKEVTINMFDFVDPIGLPNTRIANTLQRALSENREITITYKNKQGLTIKTTIKPFYIGEIEPDGHPKFFGLRAYAPELKPGNESKPGTFIFKNILSAKLD